MKKQLPLAVLFFLLLNMCLQGQTITPVSGFGTNPGALNMYMYVPSGISGPAPLVIAMHGCTENASTFAAQTGWNKLADLHKFYVIYPEQISANNSSLCFNWFDTTDVNRNVGEALSIKQMVDYMKAHYAIDASAVFATGISAGGGMTSVMMAAYPDVINKGAVMSGIPYKAATDPTTAYTAMSSGIVKTPAQWGALVRAQNPGYTGSYPRLAIFQGTLDFTVNPTNATELMKQWTNLNHADQTVDSTNSSFQGNSNIVLTIYNDSSFVPVVYMYKVTNMGHAIAVDTGACPRKGGATGTYASEQTNFHSTYWAADFFNLIPGPYSITGAINVATGASGITYSVPATSGSTFVWTVPPGATILSGQGTNTISVHFATLSGYVEVTETPSAGCKKDAATLWVNVGIATVINEGPLPLSRMYYIPAENRIQTENIPFPALKTLHIYNLPGQDCTTSFSIEGSSIMLRNALPKGIYVISMTDGNRKYTGKIVVF
ncbi:MAG TPA: PHB depolymerase family esterase [Bacteroidia bacterium]|jgi:poly(hydroxyalkanoate) depolymerase family esterase|nr:PHB depolymerase family esterase [Bacteroidia bacterium]